MFECPDCGSIFENGVPICPECGAVVDNPSDGSVGFYNDDFIFIYACFDLYEAEMLKANLESGGIPTWIVNKKDSSYPGLGNMSAIQLFVRVEDSEAAFEFLKSYEDAKKIPPAGGNENEETFN